MVRQVINTMGSQIERQQDNNGCLAYWLSNTVTLLYMLQRNIKPASGGTYQQRLRSPTSRCASGRRVMKGTSASACLIRLLKDDGHPMVHDACETECMARVKRLAGDVRAMA